MTSPHGTDFSTNTIPQSWVDAATEAPGGDGQPIAKTPQIKTPPIQISLDLFTACISATAVSITGGVAWYFLQTNGVTTPWLAVALGVILALTVRLSGGRPDVQTRGMLALLFYLVTAAAVIYLVARVNYINLYGSSPGLLDIEEELLYSRLTDPLAIVAWFAGAAASVWVSKGLR